MCKLLEEMREESWLEGNKEGKREMVLRMLANGSLSLESIAEFSGLSLDEVKKLSEGRTA